MPTSDIQGQGVTTPLPLGEAVPQSIVSRLGSGTELEGPDPYAQAAKVQDELASIAQLVERVALEHPVAGSLAKDVVGALQSMGLEIVSTLAPPPGSIPEPPGL